MCCLSKFEKLHDELLHPLTKSSLDESLWSDKCDYIDLDSSSDLNLNGLNLVVCQLNIHSVLSNQDGIKQLLAQLKCKNSEVDIMILCETFLRDHTEPQVNIPGYNLISNHRQQSNGGGTAILVCEGIIHKRRRDLDVFDEKIIESVFIETISKSGKKIIIGSIYRPPNVNPNLFITTVTELTSKLKLEQKSDIILGMDHNLDLLKLNMHRHIQCFYEIMLENNLLPTITRPTRITQSSATLIDNIFVSENLHRFFELAILLEDISDHLPTIALLKQTKMTTKAPLTFESRNLSQSKLRQINHDLHQLDWISILDSNNVDDNFDMLMFNIHSIIDKYSPVKHIRISAKR